MSSDDAGRSRVRTLIATVNGLPLDRSILAGVGAFLGGYVLFAVLVALSGSVSLSRPVTALKQIGFLFYNAHNVPLVRRTRVARTTGQPDPETGEMVNATQYSVSEETLNLLFQSDPTLPLAVYLAVPVVVLLVVGAWLTFRHVDPTDPRTSLAVVGGVTVGYLLASMIGSFLVVLRATEGQASETLGPARPLALAYGVAYPLVLASVAVVLVLAWHRYGDRAAAG